MGMQVFFHSVCVCVYAHTCTHACVCVCVCVCVCMRVGGMVCVKCTAGRIRSVGSLLSQGKC